MATFIKLSCGEDKPIWISVERIAAVDTYAKSTFPQWKASIAFSALENDYIPVCETPEQILALIQAAKES